LPTVDDVLTPACGFTVYSAIHLTGLKFSFEEGQQSGLGFIETFRNDVTSRANGKSSPSSSADTPSHGSGMTAR
jgi:hypothetical protein